MGEKIWIIDISIRNIKRCQLNYKTLDLNGKLEETLTCTTNTTIKNIKKCQLNYKTFDLNGKSKRTLTMLQNVNSETKIF